MRQLIVKQLDYDLTPVGVSKCEAAEQCHTRHIFRSDANTNQNQ